MKVVFYPPYSEVNDYINVFVDSIESAGAEIINKKWNGDINLIVRTMAEGIRARSLIFHFNWLEDNASQYGIGSKIKCLLILCFLRAFHFFGGKVVWTMHNARSHNIDNKNQEIFIRKMLNNVDRVVVHCNESINILCNQYGYSANKILYVPIGNYRSVMQRFIDENSRNTITNDSLNYLFFGSISQYKGVESLLRAFKCDEMEKGCRLTICGKPNSQELKDRIEQLSKGNNNILLDLNFVSNEELCKLIIESDVVVLPYEKDSMQNSSAAIMAFTCGKPIIISRFGYIKDIEDRSFVFCYDYKTENEKVDQLRKELVSFKLRYEKDKTSLKKISKEAMSFSENELNWTIISKKVVELYSDLGDGVE